MLVQHVRSPQCHHNIDHSEHHLDGTYFFENSLVNLSLYFHICILNKRIGGEMSKKSLVYPQLKFRLYFTYIYLSLEHLVSNIKSSFALFHHKKVLQLHQDHIFRIFAADT